MSERLIPSEPKEVNFHEVHEARKVMRVGHNESDNTNIKKVYEERIKALNKEAENFKIEDHGSFSGAKKYLRKQKEQYVESLDSTKGNLNTEKILKENPEIVPVIKIKDELEDLTGFRMKRLMDNLNPSLSKAVRKANEAVIKTANSEIASKREALMGTDLKALRMADILEYRLQLGTEGHICITPSVQKDLDAIGDRLLTGKSIFLHGPTGTGKTSLARFASKEFTGKDPEMVYCNPQTRESNIWGKTGIRPVDGGKSGAIETVEIYGPLARAMQEGKSVIFDEFTALPQEQMVFIKGILNARPGDRVNIVGNGVVQIAQGFQMIFTANLKSDKNPERQALPPEMAREFEQNNIEVGYIPPEEAYDVMLARLLDENGSIQMSYYDLNNTLPNLCKVMAEIQESYVGQTNAEVASLAGAMDASGKFHSLKKFVMTQGSVEAILSAWSIEKQKGENTSFVEFLDQRFKIALRFKEYSKEDRILVAKILSARGFLTTLEAKDLDLPADVFDFNIAKTTRGDDYVGEVKGKSDKIVNFSLKEIGDLDPFHTKESQAQERAEELLGIEEETVIDPFLANVLGNFETVFGRREIKKKTLTATYTHPDSRKEQISIDIEAKIQEYIAFYQKTNINLPPDFEDTIKEVWERNYDQIQEAIEEQGFDEILIIPGNIPLTEIKDKMSMESGYYEYDSFKQGGSFAGAQSPTTVQRPRIVLVHNTQNLGDRPELASTLNVKGQDLDLTKILPLEDYIIFQRKYFEQTTKHLDETSWTWTSTKSGSRLVDAGWDPGFRRFIVDADGFGAQGGNLGARPSRCFV